MFMKLICLQNIPDDEMSFNYLWNFVFNVLIQLLYVIKPPYQTILLKIIQQKMYTPLMNFIEQ